MRRPKLPPSMYDRGPRGFYLRTWTPEKGHPRGGKDRWTPLGKELDEATKAYHRLKADPPRTPVGLTVAALAERWLATYIPTRRNEEGRKLARVRVEKHMKPFLGHMLVRRIEKDDLREYRLHLERKTDERTKRTLKPNTVAHVLSDVRCMLNYAVDSGLLDRDLVPRRLLPRAPEEPPKGLTTEEQVAVSTIEDPWGFACRIMLGTGVRWGELLRLDSADVDGGEIVVHGATKSGRMRRIPVPPALLAELRRHVGRLVRWTDARKDGPTFNRCVARRSGVATFGAHRCRHSFGFNYGAAGGNIRVLQLLMGHASIETTMRYGKPTQDLAREDARKVIGWNPDA